jgi:hypothetical protein
MTGEECSGGHLFALDSIHQTLYDISGVTGSAAGAGNGGMAFGPWENAAMIDTGETRHVALLLLPDSNNNGGDYLRIYIGAKGKNARGNQASDFLSHDGLAYGKWYYLTADFPDLGNTNRNGSFSSSSRGALGDGKMEDVDTSPSNPTSVVLAEQSEGVFTLDFNLNFGGASFNAAGSGFLVTKIVDDNSNYVNGPDNVDWTAATASDPDGLVFVKEDSNRGVIWRMRPDGSSKVKIGETTNGDGSSGIFDISNLLDFAPGTIMVTNSMANPASMALLINPSSEGTPNEEVSGPQASLSPAPEGVIIHEAEAALLDRVTIPEDSGGFSGDVYANFQGYNPIQNGPLILQGQVPLKYWFATRLRILAKQIILSMEKQKVLLPFLGRVHGRTGIQRH